MSLRTVVFVDGANFRENLRSFAFRTEPPHPTNPDYRLEEQHFQWRQFFRRIVGKFSEATGWDHQLVRVYWYHPRSITPYSASEHLAQQVVNRHRDIANLTTLEVHQAARKWWERERDYFQRMRDEVYESIQRKTDFLEFKYVGQYNVRPYDVYRIQRHADGSLLYLGRQQGEKGVDIGIAVDMIAKMRNYDAAVLVSGDADFLPVVGYLKDGLKYVYQFSLARGIPPKITYLSPWLKTLVDCFQFFDELELLSNYLDRRSGIPLPILTAIDARMAELSAGLPGLI